MAAAEKVPAHAPVDDSCPAEPELSQGADRLALQGSMLRSVHTSAVDVVGGPL